ncbi:MAG: porphobilinogen synthase [Bdellovibrio sp.]|nr:porphobilinogen synthase [Bdellovibrio sp.]
MAANSMSDFERYSKMGLRRLRGSRWIRELVAENRVSVDQMVQPLFVVDGISRPEAVPGMTGVFRETPDSLLKQIENDLEKGVRKFILFGVPADKREKDFSASFTANQISEIRKRFGKDLFLSVDVCLCSYTAHGHCGVIPPEGDHVDNEASVQALADLALSYAQAGADCVAPSDMMDGRIGAIRTLLDQNKLYSTLVMSYSAKFHSKFYGPFRNAADSAPKSQSLKDRATYQIDPSRMNDAFLSSLRDSEEGADILMVKPGLPYLDVLARLSDQIKKPWAVYEVSGEYAGVEVLAQNGLMSAPAAHLEAWTAFVRAGASIIITYGARNAKDYLSALS